MARDPRFDWPSPAQAERNAIAMRAELENELAEFEREFGFPSAELAKRVGCGQLPETYAVCRWLLAIDALKSLEVGG